MSSPIPISASGVSTAFGYPTQAGQGQGVSPTISASPDSVNFPIIFEPPPAMAGNSINVEIIVSGKNNWGGCQVYMSLDNTTYTLMGVVFAGQVQGVLTNTFPAGSDPDTTNILSVDVSQSLGTINPSAQAYADTFLSLAWVDGEIIAYTGATLTSSYNYNLATYIRRGVYGTPVAAHIAGKLFGLILGSSFRQTFPFNLIGQTIYFKFPSFNTMGLQAQALSDCAVYTHILEGAGLSPNPWFQPWSVGGHFSDFVIDPWDGNYEIFDIQMPVQMTFAPNFSGSPVPGCEIAPTSVATLYIQKVSGGSATIIGSVTFNSGSTTGFYSMSTSQVFNVGDRMRLYAPSTINTTIAGCYGTIVGSQPQA